MSDFYTRLEQEGKIAILAGRPMPITMLIANRMEALEIIICLSSLVSLTALVLVIIKMVRG